MSAPKSIQLGSGRLYLKKVTTETAIPALKALCIAANEAAYIKGGCHIQHSITTKEVYSDTRDVDETFATGESCSISTGLMTWNTDVIKSLLSHESTGTDGEILVGAKGLTTLDKYIVIFESVPNTDNVVYRFGMIGANTKGLDAEFKPEDPTIIDATWNAIADADGHFLRIETETVTA